MRTTVEVLLPTDNRTSPRLERSFMESQPSVHPLAQSFKILAYALMGAPFVMALAVYFTLAGTDNSTVPVFPFLAFLSIAGVLGYASWAMIKQFPVFAPGEEIEHFEASWARLQPTFMLRFALSEAIMIIAVALAFVMGSGGLAIIATGLIMSEIFLYLTFYPSKANLKRVEDHINSEGGRANLTQYFYPQG